MTDAQKRAFTQLWPRWGLAVTDGPLDARACFERVAPLVLEIGFGMGQSLVSMARNHPESDFIGIEVHRPGVGKLLHTLAEQDIRNVRVYCHDAVEVLQHCIPEQSLDTVQIFFPDPWHKKRHHKRRLIQPEFVAQLVARLKPGGKLHLATDWEHYAEHMLAVLGACSGLCNGFGEGNYAPRPETRPLTRFERRGESLGHGVRDLVFYRQAR